MKNLKIIYFFLVAIILFSSKGIAYAGEDTLANTVDSIHKTIRRAASSSISDGYNITIPQYTPSSPNVAGLLSQIDYPVSLYTGVPNISIPIYQIETDNINIPITLSYNASGIRVSQEASWVGLGWNLNIGGLVSRTIKGGDDFNEQGVPPGYIREGYLTAPEVDYPRDSGYFSKTIFQNVVRYTTSNLIKDSEPDIFYFSLPGASGKFLIDKSRGAVLLDKMQNVKIELLDGVSNQKKIKITTPDGTIYNFENCEKTSSYSREGILNMNLSDATKFDEYEDKLDLIYSSPFFYTSSWFLTDITTVNNQHVTFNYERESYQSPVQESANKYNFEKISAGDKVVGPLNQTLYSCSKSVVNTWRLSEIKWNGGSIVLNSSSREDEIGSRYGGVPQKLSSLEIRNNNGIIKKYAFSYDYFNNNYSGKYPQVFKRLKLIGLNEDSDVNNRYAFDYYSGSLPAKNSKNADFWGYYNGVNQGADYYNPVIRNGKMYNGADKTSNPKYMNVGTLKSINQPTGGMTTFIYETNKYKPTSDTRIVNHLCNEAINVFNQYHYDTYSQYPKTVSKEITLLTYTDFEFSGFAENEGCVEDTGVWYDHDDYATFRICKIKSDGSKQQIDYYPTPSEMKTDCSYTFPRKTLCLAPGRYVFEAVAQAKDTWYAFSYKYNKIDTIKSDSIMNGGGLRIAEIKGMVNKFYQYDGGQLLINPICGHTVYFREIEILDYNPAAPILTIECFSKYLVQTSESTIPLSTLKDGNIFGYTTVREKTDNTYLTKYFLNAKEDEILSSNDELAYNVPPRYNPYNGLTRMIDYGGIKTETYGYEEREGPTVKGFVFDQTTDRIEDYSYEIKWPILKDVTTKIKEQNGTITTRNEYTYDDNFMKLTENINNGTDVYTKEFVYPDKKSTSILKSMCDRYMIGVPVETRLLLNGSIIKGKKTEYIDTLGMIVPKEENILEGGIFKPRLIYSCYNKYGKPMSIDNDGNNTVYLWSYNGMYPIAEIKNTTYQQVVQKLSESFISTLADKECPSLSDMSTINALRNSLKGTLVTTFIYNPLVGVTSVTDGRGFTTNYDYDSSGRLIDSYYTKNTNKCVMNKYQYHYSNK